MLRTILAKSDLSQEMIRELFIAIMPKNIRSSVIAVKSLSLDELAVAADQMISSGKYSAAKNTLFPIDHKKSEQSATSCNSDIFSRMYLLEKKLNDILTLLSLKNQINSTDSIFLIALTKVISGKLVNNQTFVGFIKHSDVVQRNAPNPVILLREVT